MKFLSDKTFRELSSKNKESPTISGGRTRRVKPEPEKNDGVSEL